MNWMVTDAQLARARAEVEAWIDFSRRLARDDPDRGFYLPGDPRPPLPWWRRWFKIPPPL